MTKKILSVFPTDYRVYVEVFGGGASILLAKPKSVVEVYNDLDQGLVHFFTILRDHTEELQRLATLTPYSRQVYNDCRKTWREEKDPIRRAWKWYVVARQSFGGEFGRAWGYNVVSTCGRAMCVSTC